MNDYQVRIRYAGSVLLEVRAQKETDAQEKGEQIIQEMDSDTFLSALEPQHQGTEVTRLCSKCKCEHHSKKQGLRNTGEGK